MDIRIGVLYCNDCTDKDYCLGYEPGAACAIECIADEGAEKSDLLLEVEE
jgi:hypothetical protein